MKLPETPKDFEKLMKNVDFTRVMQILIPILQPVIIGGLWLGLSKIDSRASALSALITICEPIPTMDLNLPPPVVLASMYHSVDEEILPEKLDPQDIVSDYQDCVNGYERDTPKILQNRVSKGLYLQGCLLRKGYAQKVVLEYIRKALD